MITQVLTRDQKLPPFPVLLHPPPPITRYLQTRSHHRHLFPHRSLRISQLNPPRCPTSSTALHLIIRRTQTRLPIPRRHTELMADTTAFLLPIRGLVQWETRCMAAMGRCTEEWVEWVECTGVTQADRDLWEKTQTV